jgi:hypothetical protein
MKKSYQPINNIAKDDNGDLLAGSHNISKLLFSVIECA